MIVLIDKKEYDVPDSVGNKVNQARAYWIATGGMTPVETENFINQLAIETKEIRNKVEDILNMMGLPNKI